jgi:hypothetical protein
MLKLYVLQNREVLLTVGAGLVLVLLFFLAYVPMKRPRIPETFQHDDAPRPSTWREAWSYVPWILILVYLGTFVYSVIDITWKSVHPPNY